MDLLRAVGTILRTYRVMRGHSQEKLAEMTGLHRTYIGSVERGERNVSCKNLALLLETLGVSWEEFGHELDKHGHFAVGANIREDRG